MKIIVPIFTVMKEKPAFRRVDLHHYERGKCMTITKSGYGFFIPLCKRTRIFFMDPALQWAERNECNEKD